MSISFFIILFSLKHCEIWKKGYFDCRFEGHRNALFVKLMGVVSRIFEKYRGLSIFLKPEPSANVSLGGLGIGL